MPIHTSRRAQGECGDDPIGAIGMVEGFSLGRLQMQDPRLRLQGHHFQPE